MAKILELAELSAASYGDTTIPEGWTQIDKRVADDGYLGIAYENTATKEIVIANRGTRGFTSLSDLITDAEIAAKEKTPAQDDAIRFAQKIADMIQFDPQYAGYSLVETGHSLGGNEAQAVVAALTEDSHYRTIPLSCVTFNSPGIPDDAFHQDPTTYNVLNIFTQGDWVHDFGGTRLGTSVSVAAGPTTAQEWADFVSTFEIGDAFGIPLALEMATAVLGNDVLNKAHAIKTLISFLQTDPLGAMTEQDYLQGAAGGATGAAEPQVLRNADGSLSLADGSGSAVTLQPGAGQSLTETFTLGSSAQLQGLLDPQAVSQELAATGAVTLSAQELEQNPDSWLSSSSLLGRIDANALCVTDAGSGGSQSAFTIPISDSAPVYIYNPPAPGRSAVERIESVTGEGSVWVGLTQLTGGSADSLTVSGNQYTWTDVNGTAYAFTPADGANGSVGTLKISDGSLGEGSDNAILIEHFDLSQAQSDPNGYLGIHVSPAVALALGAAPQSLAQVLADPVTAADPAPGAVTYTAYVSTVSDAAQTLTLGMSRGDAGGFALVGEGGSLQPLGGGAVLTVAPGHDSVTFTLVNTKPLASPEAVELTVSATNPLPSGAPIQAKLEVDYGASPGAGSGQATPGTPDQVITGDVSKGNETSLYGSQGNDLITISGDGSATIVGYNGDDTITGGNGNYEIWTDTGSSDDNNNRVTVGNGNDTIWAIDGNNWIATGDGQDFISAGDGDNVIEAHDGQDVIQLGDGNNAVYGGAKTDLATAISASQSGQASGEKGSFIAVGGGENTLVGGSGNDMFVLRGGDDVVVCGPGNDTIVGGEKATINETATGDQAWYLQPTVSLWSPGDPTTGPLYFDGEAILSSGGYTGAGTFPEVNVDSVGAPVGGGSETIFGGAGNDIIAGSNGPGNYIDVGSGDSKVFSGAGNDTISAGSGNSTINGQAGDDYIDGGAGNQNIYGGYGNDTIYGGSGNDTLNAGEGDQAWAISNHGDNYIDGGTGNALIFGAGGNDTLVAGSGDSTVLGGAGQELIMGGAGRDVLFSGSTVDAGVDTIIAGSGESTLYGGAGDDFLYGGDGTDVIVGGSGTEVIEAGDGGTADAPTRVETGSGSATVYAGAGVDQILGGSGKDTLIGGSGDATLQGGSGTELLQAGTGNDTLIAGSGHDTLVGGIGQSTLQGGSGSTRFIAGSGENVFVGGGGQNTYELEPGFGAIEIQPGTAGDVLQFGGGIGLADLAVTGSLDAAGGPVLEIDAANGGSVSIAGGLTGSLDQFDVAGIDYTARQLVQAAYSGVDASAGTNGELIFSAYAGDTLVGGTGNDTLAALGANTTLSGGGGDTLFLVNDPTQVVTEANLGRNDTIQSSVSYVLPENVGDLMLTGYADLTATGNEQANVLSANSGNDTLIAGGGVATLVGGAGYDTFVVNNAADVVQAQEGANRVKTSVSYVLPDHVQELIGTGSADITLTGNGEDGTTVTANGGNDTLIAGAGTTTLVGGTGDDTFVVSNAADEVQAQAGGTDTVETSVSYVLPEHVANLTGTGSADITLTAGSADNVTVTANAGNDTLQGGGGTGTLVGGPGLDTFVLGADGSYTAEKAGGADAIMQLMQGLDFSTDVTALQAGNDLLLQAGLTSSLRLKDYFTGSGQWRLEDAQGNRTTGAALIAATAARTTDRLTRLEAQFETDVKRQYVSRLLSEGYALQTDGSWYDAPSNIGVRAQYTQTTRSSWATYSDGSVRNSDIHTESFDIDSWLKFFADRRANIQHTIADGTAAVINQNAIDTSWTSSNVWLKVNWGTLTPAGSSSYPVNASEVYHPGNVGTDKPVLTGGPELVTSNVFTVDGTPDGSLAEATVASPSGYRFSGAFPEIVDFEYDHEHRDYNIEEIDVAAGNHTVNGSRFTLVNAGSGDNYIKDAGFVDARTGDDTIIAAGTVFCESGNDTINGSTSIYQPQGDTTVYGGSGDAVVLNSDVFYSGSGDARIRNVDSVYGGSGDESIVGASTVMAGTGTDTIFGSGLDADYVRTIRMFNQNGIAIDPRFGLGFDSVTVNADVGGMDLIGNLQDSDTEFLDAYYNAQGVSDGAERYRYGGMYLSTWLGDGFKQYLSSQEMSNRLQSMGYTGSLQQAIADGYIDHYVEPVPATVPLIGLADSLTPPAASYTAAGRTVTTTVSANDFAALAAYFDDGSVPATTLKFGPGIHPGDLQFSWGTETTDLGTLAEPASYETLNISWGMDKGVRVIIPHADEPIGSGVQEFLFADGTKMNIADMLVFTFHSGMGRQDLPASARQITFAAGIDFSQLGISTEGDDLLIAVPGSADALRIPNGAVDSALVSDLSFTFADGSTMRYSGDNAGNGTFTHDDASGNTIGDLWMHADGSHGGDTFNADGSSTGTTHYPDGSDTTYTNDGTGDITTLNFDAAGAFVGDHWQRANGSHGSDTLDSASGEFTGSYTLASGTSVLVNTNVPADVLTSSAAADTLTGDAATAALFGFGINDTLTAGAGGDLVYGSGDGDVLVGGSGNDTLIGTGNNDTFVINAGSGVDRIVAAGADATLVFGPGITPDVITLGIGSLLLRLGPDGQAVHIEGFDPQNALGTSSIQSFRFADGSIWTYDELLARGFDLYAGSGDVSLSGTDLDNRLYGGSGNDTLIGTGHNDTLTAGTGLATLIGGSGNETYVVDNPGDVVIAQAGAAGNTIETSVSYTAPDNVQNLTLTGTADISGSGNSLDNVIIGNAGDNVLNGGTGADTLTGGVGNDSYIVDNPGDVVIERANGGLDTVRSSVDYVLPDNVENLTLTGSADLSGTGDALDNIITGNDGTDTLNGAAGNDTLIGGSGNDTFVYNRGDGLDVITLVGETNSVRFGGGLSVQNVSLRLTTAGGQPYTVFDRTGNGQDAWVHGYDRNLPLSLTAQVRLLDGNGDEQPDEGMDFTVTVNRQGKITSPIQSFAFAEGTSVSFDDLLVKTDRIDARRTNGPVIAGRNDDIIHAERCNTGVWAGSGNDRVYADNQGTLAFGEGGDDYLRGKHGNDTLDGGWGVDVVNGRGGSDVLSDPGGNSALLGGHGNDTITAGAGNDFIAGGPGDDRIVTGATDNIIAFNRGDGNDILLGTPGASGTLSLGRVDESDLRLARRDNDLILEVDNRHHGPHGHHGHHSPGDSITLKGWYTDPSSQDLTTLQVIGGEAEGNRSRGGHGAQAQVQSFDFGKLVAQYDAARAADPALPEWNLSEGLASALWGTAPAQSGQPVTAWADMNARLDAHLQDNDPAVLGGALAWEYAMQSGTDELGLGVAQATLREGQFGQAAQTVQRRESGHGVTAR